MLSTHLPGAHLSPGSTSFCLYRNILFPSALITLVLLTVVLICNHGTHSPNCKAPTSCTHGDFPTQH